MAVQSKVNLIQYIIGKMNNSVNLTNIVDEDKTGEVISVDNVRTARYYRIVYPGNTIWANLGASDNTAGTVFQCINIRNGNPESDSTGTVEEVFPIFGENPFIPNVFKYFDNGMIRDLLDIPNIPAEELPDAKRYILVEITNAELEKETIYSVVGNTPDEIPLESWIGSIGVELLVWAENKDIYQKVYDALLIMHDTEFRDVITTNNNIIPDGIERSIDIKSRVFKDGEQLININGDYFKEMFFPININITNKGILRSSRFRIQYRVSDDGVEPQIWEEIPLGSSAKDFKYSKLHQDDTNSGESVRKSVADIADRELAFNVVLDKDKEFIKKLKQEMRKSRYDDTNYVYNFKIIEEYPDGYIDDTLELKMSLAQAVPNNSSNYTVYLLTFIEVA